MRKPRIGVTMCSKNEDYLESVRRAGGEPVVLDWSDGTSPDEVLRTIDGVLMTGGPDLDPKEYGEPRDARVVSIADPARDRFELELARKALVLDTPLLAICRGMQVLNVAAGGSLLQDIPSVAPESEPHDVKEPKNAQAHPVRIARDSRLASVMGRTEAQVNSRHHQAVKRPGENLLVTATSPDGIVEAIEKPGARFCIGVEWHPENFVESGEFMPLFEGLVKAASRR